MPPELATERLTLRGHWLADFEPMFAMWSDIEVVRHIGGRPSTEEEAWSRLLRYFGMWPALGFGYWLMLERNTDRFIGEIGLADFRRDIEPALSGPEAGWVLSAWAHGRGFATEGLLAVLNWADRSLSAERTQCMIAPGNVLSMRVAKKAGYSEYADTTFKGAPVTIFDRPRCDICFDEKRATIPQELE